MDPATVATNALDEFGPKWEQLQTRLEIVPGKEVLTELRQSITDRYGVSLNDNRIVSSYRKEEVPSDLSNFLMSLEQFRTADAPMGGTMGSKSVD